MQIQGEVGQNKLNSFDTPEKAVKDFEKKFKDKTKNDWSNRSNFVTHPGKYTLIEVEGEQDAEVKASALLFQPADVGVIDGSRTQHLLSFSLQVDSVDGKAVKVPKNTLPCTLDEATQKLITLIFSNDMFKEAMECMDLGKCVSVLHLFIHLYLFSGLCGYLFELFLTEEQVSSSHFNV